MVSGVDGEGQALLPSSRPWLLPLRVGLLLGASCPSVSSLRARKAPACPLQRAWHPPLAPAPGLPPGQPWLSSRDRAEGWQSSGDPHAHDRRPVFML